MKKELTKIAKDLEQDTITDKKARTLLLDLLGVSERNIDCVINPDSGRMRIDSVTELGSIQLDKWINDNRYCLDKRIDIEIYAH